MQISRVAYRYAKSLLQFAVEQNQIEAVYKDICVVRNLCRDSRDFRKMLKSPMVRNDKKFEIFKMIFGANIGELSMRFFDIVIRKNRDEYIYEVCNSFINQYKEYKEIDIVELESAHALNENIRKMVLDFVKTRTTNVIELVEKVDSELIGGIKIKMNDHLLDASVKSNLLKLQREFSKDLYSVKY